MDEMNEKSTIVGYRGSADKTCLLVAMLGLYPSTLSFMARNSGYRKCCVCVSCKQLSIMYMYFFLIYHL